MKIYFVTTNPEKLNEAKLVLNESGYEVEGIEFDFTEPTDGDIESIAKSKLLQITSKLGSKKPIIVDDSGIFFEAYNDFPGILTRRIFDKIGYRGVKNLLQNENRNAYFYGVIAFMWNDEIKLFNGKTHGSISENININLTEGLRFPFDPIFIPVGENITFLEMTIEEKLKYSYRKKALDQLCKWLNTNMNSVYNDD